MYAEDKFECKRVTVIYFLFSRLSSIGGSTGTDPITLPAPTDGVSLAMSLTVVNVSGQLDSQEGNIARLIILHTPFGPVSETQGEGTMFFL